MEVRLFGPVEVRRGDDVLPVSGKRPALLLRALALEPRSPVSADALVDAAWPDAPPANPSKALQTLVVRLRRATDRDLVVTVPGGYALGPGVTTDVERVGLLLRRAFEATDETRRLELLTTALDESAGAPFEDLADWRGADAEAVRAAEQRTTAEDAWLGLRLQCDGPSRVLGDLEAAVAREPLREVRWVLLAEALRDADRIADALHALERSRQKFATELGIPPSAQLQALEEELLRTAAPARPDDPALRVEHLRDRARVALADGDATLAARELTLALDEARRAGRPIATLVDLLLALSSARRRDGDVVAAAVALEEAADLARLSHDTARLAAVALAGSGDAWQTTLDPTESAIPLLQEALAALSPGPTRLRARLLARSAVAASHVEPQPELERRLAEAAEIAGAVDDSLTSATVLIAQCIVDQDPHRRPVRHARFERLLALADRHREPQWRTAVLPSLARLRAQEGDVPEALALLEETARAGAAAGDPVAAAARGTGATLHATVSGELPDVLAAIDLTARLNEAAMLDPSAASVMRWAQTGVVTFVYGRLDAVPDRVMPFPRTTMDVLMTAYVAAALGAAGRTEEGVAVLQQIEPSTFAELPRDLYWLSVLWATGRAVRELGDAERAVAILECCEPVVDLLVVDGGCLFLGAVAHHAGLAAAAAGRLDTAVELLAAATETHRRIGAPWWTAQSEHARLALVDPLTVSRDRSARGVPGNRHARVGDGLSAG